MTGEVLFGMHSIYTVLVDGKKRQCRIKGKVLRSDARAWNPIAPGDVVEIDAEGRILSLGARRTVLERWNKKGRAPQVLAANADVAVCVTSPQAPPFRPRFIDRLIVAAEAGGLDPLIVLNKVDLLSGSETADRLESYAEMGYQVLRCSARTGAGIELLAGALAGKTTVFVGQSGVGKSSVLNALQPGLGLKVGGLSAKYDRGSHTTNYPVLISSAGGLRIIDTPGIRELELADILPEDIAFHFRDFAASLQACQTPSCLHDGEPGCAVSAAVERGEVHPDRYESYRRILSELRHG
jgi:ribosome biogenesis GTPase